MNVDFINFIDFNDDWKDIKGVFLLKSQLQNEMSYDAAIQIENYVRKCIGESKFRDQKGHKEDRSTTDYYDFVVNSGKNNSPNDQQKYIGKDCNSLLNELPDDFHGHLDSEIKNIIEKWQGGKLE